MRTTRLLLFVLLLPVLPGCASLYSMTEHPEALDPVPVEASSLDAYETAIALAFNRGYNIRYTSEEDRLIELDRLDRRLFGPGTVRRLDLLIQDRGGQTYVHARYHSFDLGNPEDIDVEEEDREAARAFVEALRERL